jgi:hypothetical protein
MVSVASDAALHSTNTTWFKNQRECNQLLHTKQQSPARAVVIDIEMFYSSTIFVEYFFAEHVYYFSIVKSIYCATLSSEHMSIYKRIW